MRTEFYGFYADEYSEAVGMENGSIPNDAIKASSELDEKHSASKARLGIKPEDEQFGAWVPLESDENQWLQVDLGKNVEITKVSTQGGCDGADHRVTSYILSFGEEQEKYQEYQEQGETKVFEGNSDTDTAASHWLVYPVKARYCTLKPKTWNEQIALRLELYGKVVSDDKPVRDQQPQEPTQVADDTAGDKDEAQPQNGESQQSEAQPSQGETEAILGGDENAQAPEQVKEGASDEIKPDEGQKAEGVGESAEDESKPDEGQKSEEVGEAANDESKPEEVKEGANDEAKPEEFQKPEEVSESAQDESKPEEGEQSEETKENAHVERKPEEGQKSEEVLENADAESKPEEGQKSEEVQEKADAESKPEEGQKSEEIPENANDENKPEEGVKTGESAEEPAQPEGGVADQAETK